MPLLYDVRMTPAQRHSGGAFVVFVIVAYAWSEDGGKIIAVLKTPPVDGPLAAVRAAIAARFGDG